MSSPGRPAFLKDDSHPVLIQEPKILEIAKSHEKSAAQILLRWIVQRGIVVIPKSVTKSRIEENFDIFGFSLSQDEMDAISDLKTSLQICVPIPFKKSKFFPFVENYTE